MYIKNIFEILNNKKIKFKNKNFVLTVFLLTMVSFSSIALMFISGYLISRSAQRPENILMIYVPIVLTRAFGIIGPFFKYFADLSGHNWILRNISLIRKYFFRDLAKKTSSISNEFKTGKIVDNLINDIEQIQLLFLSILIPFFSDLVLSVILLVYSSWFTIYYFIFMLSLIIINFIFLTLFYFYKSIKTNKNISKLQEKNYLQTSDYMLGLEDLILSNRGLEKSEEQLKIINENHNNLLVIKNKKLTATILNDLLLFLFLLLTFLLFSSPVFNNISVNYIAAISLSLLPIFSIFLSMNKASLDIYRYQDSIHRFLNYFSTFSTFKDEKKIYKSDRLNKAEIYLENVSFKYDKNDDFGIRDVNLKINNKQKIAIIGKSGGGKTTLLRLLFGDLKSTEGNIEINNQDIFEVLKNNKSSDIFSVLDQKPYFFNVSIKNNFLYANPKATDEDILSSLYNVGLKSVINKLSDGINSNFSEAGNNFSGGEIQRFAIARILIKNNPIIILDEPTVSLDKKNSEKILEMIFQNFSDKTIIWVTHDLYKVELADTILMLENGKIVEKGSYDDLIKKSKRFKEINNFNSL